MRKLLPLAAFMAALVGLSANEKLNAAPVPKDPPSIDGKYTLVASSTPASPSRGGPAGTAPFGRDDGASTWASPRSSLARAETTITKKEILIDGRTGTMEYTLDTAKKPITIDVESVSVRGKKTKMLGIVEQNGNRLTIALAKEGAERPKTIDEGEGITVYYFQKFLPPKVEFKIVAMSIGKEADAEKELTKLSNEGFELVTTTNPTAPDGKSSVTTIHFVLKRVTKQQP